VQDAGHPDFGSRLEANEHHYQLPKMMSVLSQATVRRMTQLGLLMKDFIALSMSWMSWLFPSLPTLAMRPRKYLADVYGNTKNIPGKSQKERSVTSGPRICRMTRLRENVISLLSSSTSVGERNCFAGVDGLRMAHWALQIRSSTRLRS
jgi:hypothetical protein